MSNPHSGCSGSTGRCGTDPRKTPPSPHTCRPAVRRTPDKAVRSFPHSDRSEMMMMNLDISGICASAGSACTSGVENVSHVLEAIGHDPMRKTVRFSFSHFNTTEEVDYVIEKLKSITPVYERS